MTRKDYIEYHEKCCEKLVTITKAKNSDYCGNSNDPFHNFRSVERLGICSVEQGFLTRMTDKLARINSLVQKGSAEVKDETIFDTLADLANYSILFSGYLISKHSAKK